MIIKRHILVFVAATSLFGCKTPTPPAESSAPPPDQTSPAEPSEAGSADAGAEASEDVGSVEPDPSEPPDEPVDEPPKKPLSFVPEPSLPKTLGLQEMALVRTAESLNRPISIAFQPVLEGEDCGDPVEMRAALGSGDQTAWYTLDECERSVAALHAKTYSRHVTNFGVVDMSGVTIQHNGNDLWSAADPCRELDSNEACRGDFAAMNVEVPSLVGPIVSIHIRGSEVRGGGPPNHASDMFTIDTRTGTSARFDAIVTEDSLLNALKRDTFLRKRLNPRQLDAAAELDEVWELWRTQDFVHFGGYYFEEWSAEEGRVAMRLTFLESEAGLATNELEELGLWVTPKPQYVTAFEEAASGDAGYLAAE